ncbi:hypothetical protein WIW50_08860 [Flavobacteriaceae bacterium 3-367]|uniref:hypothetical protein n=1 Tax=Eudoraea algarum TaxID=3417568 RepID=UPI0032945AF9
MPVNKGITFIVLIFLFLGQIRAQDPPLKAIAEEGDGIFSILRRQGIDPIKYYADFIALNRSSLKSGNGLKKGKEYVIPRVPDSFKAMARQIQLSDGSETPLFGREVADFVRKDSSLNKVVYYLVSIQERHEAAEKNVKERRSEKDITLQLAKELLLRGAMVYWLNDSHASTTKTDANRNDVDETLMQTKGMDAYIDAINKRYLKHNGKYQRLLVIQERISTTGPGIDVTLYHHETSAEGKKLANNIRRMFRERNIRTRYFKSYSEVFKDKGGLYLAKNILPTMTYIEIDRNPKARKRTLADIITNGVLLDYSDLDFEDKD